MSETTYKMPPDVLLPSKNGERETPRDFTLWIYLLFFISGIPAIVYQIVWERALFAVYGINIQSVTVVVSAFMLGLGLGSLLGGAVSRNKRFPPLTLFAAAELGTATFGFLSLGIFHQVTAATLAQPVWVTGFLTFMLVWFPTMLMGSTLPLLVEHFSIKLTNVGASVGALYFVNTLGSGAACIIVVRPLLNQFGQTWSVRYVAMLNIVVGVSALLLSSRSEFSRELPRNVVAETSPRISRPSLPFGLALLCSAFCGFSALSYEIIWYRLLAFASEDTAPLFASLLGSYLIGIALGSRFGEGYADRHSPRETVPTLAIVLLGSGIVSFWINPACGWILKFIPIGHGPLLLAAAFIFLIGVCHATILFGALFPLIAHVSVGHSRAGQGVSYLYAGNIAGSTLGILLVGFVLMNKLSLYGVACLLLAGSLSCAFLVGLRSPTLLRGRTGVVAVFCILAVIFGPATRSVFNSIYDRMLFKNLFPRAHFEQLIANRSGTVGVTPNGIVFGGGVYDGHFSTDLLNDVNIIVRPYALSAFHSNPARVLMIGLGSGSWAQVIVNNPAVRELTIVEINPGYLQAIEKHTETASLLGNEKVSIVIDDGRRWLLRHPQERFDAIVMNTSFFWRNHSTDLLSADFLRIIHSHLFQDGVVYYNTTGSDDVAATGLSVFPYGLRVHNALALSDSPLKFNRERWKAVLLSYRIDGKAIIDSSRPEELQKLDKIVNTPEAPPFGNWDSIESNEAMRQRLQKRKNLIITDDNMALEWQ